MLYLNQGDWFGYQIFSSEWIDYSTTPAQASDGKYGAQIWLNQANEYSSVPREFYYADGFGGQKKFNHSLQKLSHYRPKWTTT